MYPRRSHGCTERQRVSKRASNSRQRREPHCTRGVAKGVASDTEIPSEARTRESGESNTVPEAQKSQWCSERQRASERG
jgi:hypothetical protein